MVKIRFLALIVLIIGGGMGCLVYATEVALPGATLDRPFKLGLDLQGGSHLVYEADTTALAPTDVNDAMDSLREVIERRINAFGVAEPLIQVEQSGLGNDAKHRLIVELPGVTDLKEALALINVTPLLEFRTELDRSALTPSQLAELNKVASSTAQAIFVPTKLTGRFLKHASVEFTQRSLGPSIALQFNNEGAKLFGEITTANVGKPIAIYLDGVPISAPVVREAITDGKAQISGQFTVTEARELVRNLNLGALPVPIALLSTETIDATLGKEALDQGVRAGLIGLIIVAAFMILWYRVNGLLAVLSLGIYVSLMLMIFKLLPVTLTAAGTAGFILSVGMAVDANILIFARLKEEMKQTQNMHEAIKHAFSRAWASIRDSNLSSIISALILFWFGTSLVRGFALTLAIGVLVSMLTAISITRTFLLAIGARHTNKLNRILFGSGLNH